jgi:hypothetical protein
MKNIVAAPLQTRSDTLFDLSRYTSLIIAYRLGSLQNLGEQADTITFWNGSASKVRKNYESQEELKTLEEFVNNQINERNILLQSNFDIYRVANIDLSDIDPIYTNLALRYINYLFEQKYFLEKKIDMTYCPNCGKCIAPISVKVIICSCGNRKLEQKNVERFVLPFTEERKDEILYKLAFIGNSFGAVDFEQRLSSLPDEVIINKSGNNGVGHKNIAEYTHIDPKIILSLFPLISRELGSPIDTIVQGADTAINTIPFTCMLTNEYPEYLLHSRIKYPLFEYQNLQKAFVNSYIPLNFISNNTPLNKNQVDQLFSEHHKTKRKLESCIEYFSKLPIQEEYIELDMQDLMTIDGIFEKIDVSNIREAILLLRKFIYERLSLVYIDKYAKKDGKVLKLELLDQMSNLFELIYGDLCLS